MAVNCTGLSSPPDEAAACGRRWGGADTGKGDGAIVESGGTPTAVVSARGVGSGGGVSWAWAVLAAKATTMGVEIDGRPDVVTVRGRVAVRDGAFVGEPGRGRLLRREPRDAAAPSARDDAAASA